MHFSESNPTTRTGSFTLEILVLFDQQRYKAIDFSTTQIHEID
jgi:hypothetical protein